MYHAQRWNSGNRLVYRALLFFESLSFSVADHIITTNQSYKEVALARGGVKPDQITIVRNGPEDLQSIPVPPDHELREKAGTIIGYVGVMGFQDGVDYLIRALAHLVNDLGKTDFYCVIIGKGNAVSSLKELTTSLGLDAYVWFTGFIPTADMIRYLSTADICVDPDPSNPFNDRSSMIKMTEYMAYGKPIVAFDLPEHRMTAQGAALYARPNEELDFARKLADLMDNPEKRHRMGKLGRERIEKELAWSCQEPKIIAAYERILKLVPSNG
jgi:glycosyltransferase involved in cell wall biosynthesis